MSQVERKQLRQEYIDGLDHGNIEQRAAAVAMRWGNVDSAHHKQWVIDQMIRIICGAAYETVIRHYELDGSEWDTGIAP